MYRFLLLCLIGTSPIAAHGDDTASLPLAEVTNEVLTSDTDGALALAYTPESEAERRWFIHVGFINAYPKLKSEELIEYFDIAMHILAPGYEDVTTVGDWRDDNLLWQPQIGFGYKINDKWSFAAQTGLAWGTVRTTATDTSIILLPLHTDFAIKRGAIFFGAGFDYFPFKMMEHRGYDGFWDRIKGARPFVGGSVTLTRAWYEANIKVGVPVLPNLAIELEDKWFTTSLNLHLGVDVPITRYGGVSINYGQNFFLEEGDDFAGTALSVEWKHFIRTPKKAL